MAPLRQILGDLREAAQPAFRVVQSGHDDPRPEPGVVLADSPALVLRAALLPRDGELAPGLAGFDVLGAVEPREMLADDLARLVALDAARAGVPARDHAVRAQHVDGVVLDALHQQPEALLA